MKISYNWLRQFIDLEWDAHKTAALLTDLGLEVEGVSAFESVKGGLQGIVVGEVTSCEKHPNADRLKLTRVNLGQGEPVQIVCGAPNVAVGQKVPVATIGTTLYSAEGEAWKIKKGKIRGEESHGMICAEDELGLGDNHDGIMVLDDALKPGTPCSDIFEIELDEVTLSSLLVQDSPYWLQNRLKAIGLSPINNVVDATNYVLHELGQPLHAFDAVKIKGGKINVKTLSKGTKFTTLDGVERELHEEDLMICDSEKPMCIAGVFGGQYSGVTKETTSIFLESAYFDPVSIRKSAKRHSLNTDASFRFERGIDITKTEYALLRAAQLIKEIAGGEISSEVVDLYPNKNEDFEVFLTFEHINKLTGQEIPKDSIKSILASLEIKVVNVTETGLGLIIPSYRTDVQREVDVIEEILRVYGYNKIGFNEKFTTSIARSSNTESHKLQKTIGDFLTSQGFYEIMTNSLVPKEHQNFISDNAKGSAVEILNPLSGDLAVMRQSLLFSGLEAIVHNQNRQNHNLKFFEFGHVYSKNGEKNIENSFLSLWLTGSRNQSHWTRKEETVGFFTLKGYLESILHRLGINEIKETTFKNSLISEGLQYRKGETLIAEFGILNTSILKAFDLKSNVLFANLFWDDLVKTVQSESITFSEIPKFPEVKRDFALLLNTNIPFKDLKKLAFETEKKLLQEVSLFDVYKGKNLPEGKKSYAVSFTLQDTQKTLTDKQIDSAMKKLHEAFKTKLGAELR